MWETRSVFHIPMPRLLGQDCHRRRGPVAQRRVRPLRVVVDPPLLNHHLGLLQRVEDFSVQAFIPQLAVEALAVPVLPRTPGLDVQGLRPHPGQPLPQLLSYKLRAVVGTDVLRNTVHQHHIGQSLDQIVTIQPPRYPDRQTLPAVLVDQSQHPQGSSIVGAGADEVVTPHVVLSLWPQPHTRAVVQPQTSPRSLFLRHAQTLPPPDPLHPVLTHTPARFAQLHGDPPIPVASVLAGQLQDGPGEAILAVVLCRDISLRASPLPQQPASMPLTQPVLPMSMLDRATSPFRA